MRQVLCGRYFGGGHARPKLLPLRSTWLPFRVQKLSECRLNDDFDLPLQGIAASRANLFFLTNPHAPSGKECGLADLEKAIENFSGIMVIDEAYADFASHNSISHSSKYDNLIITRTLSKSYSLAGLRVGYALPPLPLFPF